MLHLLFLFLYFFPYMHNLFPSFVLLSTVYSYFFLRLHIVSSYSSYSPFLFLHHLYCYYYINLIVLLVRCWPLLSYSKTIQTVPSKWQGVFTILFFTSDTTQSIWQQWRILYVCRPCNKPRPTPQRGAYLRRLVTELPAYYSCVRNI
jgi:hypothetical protein